MMFLRSFLKNQVLLLLVLAVTAQKLFADTISIGDGFSLSTLDNATFLCVHPGQSNAGYTSIAPTTFQLCDLNGNSSGGGSSATYGRTVTAQSTANNLWLTLDPGTHSIPGYIRNNATQPSFWEQLYFIPINSTDGQPMNDGDHVYLAHSPDGGTTIFYVVLNGGSATTSSDYSDATPLIIHAASFSPYSPASNSNLEILYGNDIALSTGSGPGQRWLNRVDDGTASMEITSNGYELLLQAGGNYSGGPIYYGQTVSLRTDYYFITMKPAPGSVLINTQTPGVWENLYFISVNGRNGDPIYDQDSLYLVRNSLTSGNYVTEYVVVNGNGTISTTVNAAAATPFTIHNI